MVVWIPGRHCEQYNWEVWSRGMILNNFPLGTIREEAILIFYRVAYYDTSLTGVGADPFQSSTGTKPCSTQQNHILHVQLHHFWINLHLSFVILR